MNIRGAIGANRLNRRWSRHFPAISPVEYRILYARIAVTSPFSSICRSREVAAAMMRPSCPKLTLVYFAHHVFLSMFRLRISFPSRGSISRTCRALSIGRMQHQNPPLENVTQFSTPDRGHQRGDESDRRPSSRIDAQTVRLYGCCITTTINTRSGIRSIKCATIEPQEEAFGRAQISGRDMELATGTGWLWRLFGGERYFHRALVYREG